MLEYDKIDINEGIDINKNISISKRCWLCGYWYFIDNFNYQKYMCNGCHNMSLKAISLHNLCIGYNNGNALVKNAIIIDKKGIL